MLIFARRSKKAGAGEIASGSCGLGLPLSALRAALKRGADVAVEHIAEIGEESVRLALHAVAQPVGRQPGEGGGIKAREGEDLALADVESLGLFLYIGEYAGKNGFVVVARSRMLRWAES